MIEVIQDKSTEDKIYGTRNRRLRRTMYDGGGGTPPMYDLRFGEFPRLRANLAKFAVLSGLLPLSVENAWGNRLNELGEIFIGTCVFFC